MYVYLWVYVSICDCACPSIVCMYMSVYVYVIAMDPVCMDARVCKNHNRGILTTRFSALHTTVTLPQTI